MEPLLASVKVICRRQTAHRDRQERQTRVNVAVIGGKLQGLEACYLARKAGWQVVLVDKNPCVPAAGLADRFIELDVAGSNRPPALLAAADLLIPALENRRALAGLKRWSREYGMPVAFDHEAYATTSSKLKSNRLFESCGIATPDSWPACGCPAVAKPSTSSGSRGIRVFNDPQRLRRHVENSRQPLVVQEFVAGPSYSLEIIGRPGRYAPLTVTDLEMDAGYDCKRVRTPTLLPPAQVAEFQQSALVIAEALQLKGLMDVEVILHANRLKVIEIDARLPSQTPTAVYWSTGVNMLKLLAALMLESRPRLPESPPPGRAVIYEHIRVSPGRLAVCGEHVMARGGPVKVHSGLFGADEAITDYEPERPRWIATLIIAADDRRAAWQRRTRTLEAIRRSLGLEQYEDLRPAAADSAGCGGQP